MEYPKLAIGAGGNKAVLPQLLESFMWLAFLLSKKIMVFVGFL